MSRLFAFWLSHRAELATLLGQHVLLVAGSACRSVCSLRAGRAWPRR
jgi:hypothetical protein